MNKLKIGLIGFGKMGKIIEKLAIQKHHEIVLRVSRTNSIDLNIQNLGFLDVAIEFTAPHSAVDNLLKLANNKVPTICGTTGWLDQYDEVCDAFNQNNTPFLYASNFSIGVNVFFEINKKLSNLMNGFSSYEIDILESHHLEKKDAPSGTAITIAEQVIQNIDRKSSWLNAQPENANQLPIISKREAGVKGYHEVNYSSSIDKISIQHEAYSREGFASGALMAAEWIQDKKGIFSFGDMMEDVLKG